MKELFKEREIKGQIKILEKLYQSAILTQEQFETMITPLKKQLQDIQSQPANTK